ncbi:type IV secretory system conjugative DNA transfer family protein [Gemmata sp. G18]|uniref:Type IV secretory system conjugative DNA transfer family protein n=1 Tax=Gemmata palustris TaxID=2822762 RepID=A0ABS5BP04_9BACT|nr:type IV secretory system conjugative DNA transfer family protein [Gemmata palustris]MBP3955469.1 type IV secretory system conjugative DNA transfer family protein [Gemmata palustris]
MTLCRLILIAGIFGLAAIAAGFAARYPAVLFLAVILVGYLGGRRVIQLTSHGTARWANAADLKRAGMLGGHGLPLGKIEVRRPTFWAALKGLFDKRLHAREACVALMLSCRKLQRLPPQSEMVRLNNAVHTVVFAPSGAGKGVSLVVPFLLSCLDSLVVIDPKGENAKLTADARRRMGQRVFIIDPFGLVTKNPDTLNPIAGLRNDSPQSLDEARAIAKEIVVRGMNEPDPHWNDNAESLTAGMIVAALWTKTKSLQDVRTLLSIAESRNAAIKEMCASPVWGGMIARLGAQLANLKDKELAGVLSTANRHTAFLDTLAVAQSTGTSSFDPADLMKGKVTVYLVLPPEYLKSHAALLRLWVGTLMRACVKNGAQEKNLVHFVLDEAASLGQMDSLEDAVSLGRGYGVRCQFYYQATGQLKTCWREGRDQTLLANCTQVYFAVRDYETAEQVSNQLGEETIVVRSGGENWGGSKQSNSPDASSSRGESWGGNDNWQQQGRKLLKPEEVMTLSPRLAITFAPSVRPICTALTRYYEPGDRQPGRWKRMQETAEVWTTAVMMLSIALGAWWAVVTSPHWR